MSLSSDLIDRIIALDTAAAARVHHEYAPQGEAMPYITVSEITSVTDYALSGTPLFTETVFSVQIFAPSGMTIIAIIVQLETAFKNFRGTMGGSTVAFTRVQRNTDQAAQADGDSLIKGKALDMTFKCY